MREGDLFFSPSFSSLSFFARDSCLFIIYVVQRETERGKVSADRLVSLAIKRSLIRRCHSWRNHFRVVSATRRWSSALCALCPHVVTFSLIIPFAPIVSGHRPRRITERRRVFTTGCIQLLSSTSSDEFKLDDIDGRFVITRDVIRPSLLTLRISDDYCQKYLRLSPYSLSHLTKPFLKILIEVNWDGLNWIAKFIETNNNFNKLKFQLFKLKSWKWFLYLFTRDGMKTR